MYIGIIWRRIGIRAYRVLQKVLVQKGGILTKQGT